MAIRQGRSEIPDSEDEMMVSSPVKVSDEALDKLSTTPSVPSQDAQDMRLAANYTHQTRDEQVGSAVSGHATMDIEASQHDQTNMQLSDTASHQRPKEERSGNRLEPRVVKVSSPPMSSTKSGLAEQDAISMRTMQAGEGVLNCPALRREPNAIIDQNSGEQSTNMASSDEKVTSNEQSEQGSFASALEQSDQGASARRPSVSEARLQAHENTLLATQNSSVVGSLSLLKPKGNVSYQANEVDSDIVAAEIATTSSQTPSVDISYSASPAGFLANNIAQVVPKGSAENEMTLPRMDDNTVEPARTPAPTINHGSTSLPEQNPVNNRISEFKHDNIDNDSKYQGQLSQGDNVEQPANYAQTSEKGSSKELAPDSTHPAPPKTTQEITLAELKAQKAALLASLTSLPAIQILIEEFASSQAGLSDDDGEPTETEIMAAANKIVKDHIRLLHEYNELKDVGQGLMGLIADQRGVRIVEVQDEFGIDAND
ncbi:Nn.00g069390.m01.CDS01 [Neocucurbitaria sp. VM-36]